MTLEGSHVTCFGKSILLCDLWVKLHDTVALFLISRLYVHLPSLVQIAGLISVLTSVGGGIVWLHL